MPPLDGGPYPSIDSTTLEIGGPATDNPTLFPLPRGLERKSKRECYFGVPRPLVDGVSLAPVVKPAVAPLVD